MKKIKFSELLKQDNVVIHTPKEKQAKKLSKVLDELNYHWFNAERIVNNEKWHTFKADTCYVICLSKKIQYCCIRRALKVVEFKDIDFGNDDTLKKADRFYLMSGITTIVSIILIIASLFIFMDEKIREFAYIPILITFTLLFIGINFDELSRNNYDKVHDEEIKNLKLGYEKKLFDEKKKLDAVLDYSLKLERKIKSLRAYKVIYIDKSIKEGSDGLPSKESLLKDIGDDIDLLTPPTLTEDKGILIPISMPTLEESKIMSTFLSMHKANLEEEIQKNLKIIDKILDLAFTIKTIYHNKEKGTTCVIFKDGKRVIVKRSKGEKDSVYTAVAYAITKTLYKSNTAFTKEVDNKIKK